MDMRKYMTFTAVHEKYIGEDTASGTMMPSYEAPVDIKVFEYGKNIYVREKDMEASVSAKSYLTLADVHVKDKLNGQVIKAVNDYPESWDARVILKEALTWNT